MLGIKNSLRIRIVQRLLKEALTTLSGWTASSVLSLEMGQQGIYPRCLSPDVGADSVSLDISAQCNTAPGRDT